MIKEKNKYYALLKYGFSVEQLNEMSELEMDVVYNKIIKKNK